MRLPFFLALSLLVVAPAIASVYPHTPATAGLQVETSRDFLAAARTVSADPVGLAADELRQPMAEWIERTDEVTVQLCPDLAPLVSPDPVRAVLLFQYMMESARHQLLNQGSSARDAQVEGLRAVVELYRDFRKSHPRDTPVIAYVEGLARDFQERGLAGLRGHSCAGVVEPGP